MNSSISYGKRGGLVLAAVILASASLIVASEPNPPPESGIGKNCYIWHDGSTERPAFASTKFCETWCTDNPETGECEITQTECETQCVLLKDAVFPQAGAVTSWPTTRWTGG